MSPSNHDPKRHGYFGPCARCLEPSVIKFQGEPYCLACLGAAFDAERERAERTAALIAQRRGRRG